MYQSLQLSPASLTVSKSITCLPACVLHARVSVCMPVYLCMHAYVPAVAMCLCLLHAFQAGKLHTNRTM